MAPQGLVSHHTSHSGAPGHGLQPRAPSPQYGNPHPPGSPGPRAPTARPAPARRRLSPWKSPGGGMQAGSPALPGGPAWPGVGAAHTKRSFSCPPRVPPQGGGGQVHTFRGAFPVPAPAAPPSKASLSPHLPAAFASINTSSLPALGAWGQRPPHRPPADPEGPGPLPPRHNRLALGEAAASQARAARTELEQDPDPRPRCPVPTGGAGRPPPEPGASRPRRPWEGR